MYFWFLGYKLYGTDSVPIIYLSSSLSLCDFPTFLSAGNDMHLELTAKRGERMGVEVMLPIHMCKG